MNTTNKVKTIEINGILANDFTADIKVSEYTGLALIDFYTLKHLVNSLKLTDFDTFKKGIIDNITSTENEEELLHLLEMEINAQRTITAIGAVDIPASFPLPVVSTAIRKRSIDNLYNED